MANQRNPDFLYPFCCLLSWIDLIVSIVTLLYGLGVVIIIIQLNFFGIDDGISRIPLGFAEYMFWDDDESILGRWVKQPRDYDSSVPVWYSGIGATVVALLHINGSIKLRLSVHNMIKNPMRAVKQCASWIASSQVQVVFCVILLVGNWVFGNRMITRGCYAVLLYILIRIACLGTVRGFLYELQARAQKQYMLSMFNHLPQMIKMTRIMGTAVIRVKENKNEKNIDNNKINNEKNGKITENNKNNSNNGEYKRDFIVFM